MRRALVLLLLLGLIVLGCAQPHVRTNKPTAPPSTPKPIPKPTKTPVQIEDINKTLTDVNELLNELQNIENVSFNL